MKININKLGITPKNLGFKLCFFGEPSTEVLDWLNYWKFETEIIGKFTNIILPDNIILSDIFEEPRIFDYMDGFSPNLNKHLHLGHLTNMVIAKAFQKLGITKNTVAILGDTLDGAVEKEDALNKLHEYLNKFDYKIDQVYFASEQKTDIILEDGVGDYEGTKVFNIDGSPVVGIKSNGSTTYFYQDVALQSKLGKSTLYITGNEQDNHFHHLAKL